MLTGCILQCICAPTLLSLAEGHTEEPNSDALLGQQFGGKQFYH